MSLRTLHRRVVKLEKRGKPRRSPFVLWYGSFDNFVAMAIQPGWDDGSLDKDDILDIVEALRRWESDGTWERAYAGA